MKNYILVITHENETEIKCFSTTYEAQKEMLVDFAKETGIPINDNIELNVLMVSLNKADIKNTNIDEISAYTNNTRWNIFEVEIKGGSLTMAKQFDPNERYDVAEIYGIRALFSDNRIKKETLPSGIYTYDLRKGRAGKAIEIADEIDEDHFGTIFTTVPLLIDGNWDKSIKKLSKTLFELVDGDATIPEFLKGKGQRSLWSTFQKCQDELDGSETEADIIKCISIKAFPKDSESSEIIAKVILTRNKDKGTIYINNSARNDEKAQEAILRTLTIIDTE